MVHSSIMQEGLRLRMSSSVAEGCPTWGEAQALQAGRFLVMQHLLINKCPVSTVSWLQGTAVFPQSPIKTHQE